MEEEKSKTADIQEYMRAESLLSVVAEKFMAADKEFPTFSFERKTFLNSAGKVIGTIHNALLFFRYSDEKGRQQALRKMGNIEKYITSKGSIESINYGKYEPLRMVIEDPDTPSSIKDFLIDGIKNKEPLKELIKWLNKRGIRILSISQEEYDQIMDEQD